MNIWHYVKNNPFMYWDPFGLDSKCPFIQWLVHQGNVFNASSEPVKVIGSSGTNRFEWMVKPYHWGSENEFGMKDVDAIYEGTQVIKIRGRVGTWIHLPSLIRPDDYKKPIGVFSSWPFFSNR